MRKVHRNGGAVRLLFIDVDDLKSVNDRFGHQAGDGVLRELAALLLAGSCRETDTVARYGGDEFVVLMPDTDERRRPPGHGQDRRRPSPSATPPSNGDVPAAGQHRLHTAGWPTPKSSCSQADRSMYEMKRQRAAAT